MKILILKPSSLGDVVQALPVLRLIKRHLPDSEIHWWIDARLADLLDGDPDLAGIVRFERQRLGAGQSWVDLMRSIGWMREQRFDWVIDLQCLARSGAVAWLANGETTIGLDEPREGARGFYDIIVPRPSWFTHAVDWYLAVLPPLGVPVHFDFTWLPERSTAAAAVRRKWSLDGARWILLQPGARWQNKRWPQKHFAELVRQLADAYKDFRFAVLGGNDDRELGATIAGADPRRCLDLTGQLSLLEMIEWIRSCEVFVSNDTGPMHVAAALGKPVVAMFGPTEPRRTGPYGQTDHVLRLNLPCVPCMKPHCAWVRPFECLQALPPSAIFDAVTARINGPEIHKTSARNSRVE